MTEQLPYVPDIKQIIVDLPVEKVPEILELIKKGEFFTTTTYKDNPNKHMMQILQAQATGTPGQFILTGEDLGAIQ